MDISMRNLCPCKDCDHRAVGCHSGCEGYLAYRANIDEAKRLKDAAVTPMSETYERAYRRKLLSQKRGRV